MSETKKYNDVIIERPPEQAWLFGGINGVENIERNAAGDWTHFLPEKEYQSGLYFDTWNCVAEAMTSTIETLMTAMFFTGELDDSDRSWLEDNGYYKNGVLNFSARAIGSLAGTKVKVGNSGFKVATAISINGLIPESKWEFNLKETNSDINNPEEYYKELPDELLKLGKDFIDRFEIKFETVWDWQIDDALKIAPLTQFVYAWFKNEDGLYDNPYKKINHAIVRKKVLAKQILDTYNPTEKALTDDYYYYPTAYKFNIKKLTEAPMLKNKFRYVLVEGQKKLYGFYKKNPKDTTGKFYHDDRDAILNTWIDENNGSIDKKSVSLSARDWKAIQPKFNLKGEEL